MGGDGQGEHHIPLVPQQVAAEAKHRLDQRRQEGGDDSDNKRRHGNTQEDGPQRSPADAVQQDLVLAQKQHQPDRQGQHKRHEIQRQHHPCRSPKLLFQ